MNGPTVKALLLDAFYQVLDNKIFRLLLVLEALIVGCFFLIGFEKLTTLGAPAALRGWLARIAVSRVHRRWRWRRLRFWAAVADDETLVDVADAGVGPDRRAELALVDGALRKLPPKLRVPWVLRHVVGCSLDEVAVACDCSLASVKRYLGRAEAAVDAHTGREAARG